MTCSSINVGLLVNYLGNLGGGVSQVVSDLNRRFGRAGSIQSISFGMDDLSKSDSLALSEGQNQRVYGWFGLLDFISKIKVLRIQILHLHGLWSFSSFYANVQIRRGMPTMISPHGMLDSWARRRSRIKKNIFGLLIENYNFRNTKCFHALTEFEARDIRRIVPYTPIFVIPNGVDVSIPPDRTNRTTKRMIYLSRIHPKKGVEHLVMAWNSIPSALRQNWQLDIYGWGETQHILDLEKIIASSALDSNVRFHGPVFGAAKKAVYDNADFFILPSKSEGLPLVVLEAWASGLPVAMTNECNLGHAFSLGAAIRIQCSVSDLAAGICECINMSDECRRNMGLCGYNIALCDYSWEKITKQYQDAYQWMVNGGSLPSFTYKQ